MAERYVGLQADPHVVILTLWEQAADAMADAPFGFVGERVLTYEQMAAMDVELAAWMRGGVLPSLVESRG